jgi:hypothetical protein
LVSLSPSVTVDPPEPATSEIVGAIVAMVALVSTTVLGLRMSPTFDDEPPSSYITA